MPITHLNHWLVSQQSTKAIHRIGKCRVSVGLGLRVSAWNPGAWEVEPKVSSRSAGLHSESPQSKANMLQSRSLPSLSFYFNCQVSTTKDASDLCQDKF